jgi:hypothetical protein
VQYFLEHGADIDSINSMNCTPFIAAVGAKQREIAEVFYFNNFILKFFIML